MQFELKTFSTKRLMYWGIWAIPCVMFLSIGLALSTGYPTLIYFFIPLTALSVYFGFRYSKTKTIIDLTDTLFLKINDEKIPYQEMVGYFVNELGLLQFAFSIRLKTNRSVHIVSANYGKDGREFSAMQAKLIKHLSDKNPELLVLDYQDVHVKQTKIIRPIVIVLAGLVMVLDILFLILILVMDDFNLPSRIFLVNFTLFALIPFIKKRKSHNSHTITPKE